MKVYLAGPMSGLPDFNFPSFDKAAATLRSWGHEVFSPADEDRKRYNTNDIEVIKQKANYRECLGADLAWICAHAEAIAMLPGWEKSTGAKIEHALAVALNLVIIYL